MTKQPKKILPDSKVGKMLSLSSAEWKRIDEEAKRKNISRSQFIREILASQKNDQGISEIILTKLFAYIGTATVAKIVNDILADEAVDDLKKFSSFTRINTLAKNNSLNVMNEIIQPATAKLISDMSGESANKFMYEMEKRLTKDEYSNLVEQVYDL